MILTGCGVCIVSLVAAWTVSFFLVGRLPPRDAAASPESAVGAGGEGGGGFTMPAWMPSWADVRHHVTGLHLPAFLRRGGTDGPSAAALAAATGASLRAAAPRHSQSARVEIIRTQEALTQLLLVSLHRG